MRLAIIPARGGSKRIPGKNTRLFCGRPMIAYALEAAVQSGIFDRIHVSTESLEVVDIVKTLGFTVDFLRDETLSDDSTGLLPVLSWVAKEYERRGLNYDDICCILPCVPLLSSLDLVKAFEIFDRNSLPLPLMAYARFPAPIEWAFRKNEHDVMFAVNAESLLMDSKELSHAYYDCGAFGIYKREHLDKRNPLSEGVLAYVLPPERAIDIDNLEDLLFAEKLYRARVK